MWFKKLYFVFILLFCFFIFNVKALDITNESIIKINDKDINKNLIDASETTHLQVNKDDVIKITSEEKIKGLYIVYYKYSDFTATLSSGEKNISIGEEGFLHQYVDINSLLGNVNFLELKYINNVDICDIYVLSEGELPSFVELWQKPVDHADILLFSTHSDDEQLFFLGLMPTYISKGAYFQVVYLAHHNDAPIRLHEQLHGLYTVGIRNYPIIGIIPDAYSTTLEGAISNLKSANMSVDDVKKFQVKMIRRFKPQVIIGHDEAGEYSHGQHILNTSVLKESIVEANNKEYILEGDENYDVWDVKKVYLHLYAENEIVLNYDLPLEYFGGKTAYEVSKEGYSKHNSQQWTWFTGWINGKNNEITLASQIDKYSPCKYGLYYSSVSDDVNKNDVMENLEYYKEIDEKKRIEELDEERYEEEKKAHAKSKKNIKDNNYILFVISLLIIFGLIILVVFINLILNKNKKD